jgi:rhamnose utilization protein RhaD (predicted bifunctional aldolase and dehydrogenase)/NAD(P)-dependent dehydrogenase (short-subunit alcohol dehydrogenase family)
MESRWQDAAARELTDPLAQRVYTSRLLGADTTLVLHGGGNTSVKGTWKDIFGDEVPVLYVKGSGSDLATIVEKDFSPVRMEALLKLAKLERLSDTEMVRELRLALMDPAAPNPSVEAILHAIIPHKFVDHTHADAIVTVTNTADGAARIREIYGDDVVVLPYVMPGFILARQCAEAFPRQATARTKGMVLLNHGIFSFGETAKESYERMIELVGRAEDYLKRKKAWSLPAAAAESESVDLRALAQLRHDIGNAAGFPMVLRSRADAAALAFCRRDDVGRISQQGPATPDHVIRTKRLPLVGRDAAAYAQAYRDYFSRNDDGKLTMLDPAPRVVLDPEFGLLSAGRSAKDAGIAEDIYRHTMEIIQRAEALGGYEALGEAPLFELEYWELEQAKLKKAGPPKPFSGEVAVVTGAASGIGKACVDSLLARGAAVVACDINPAIETIYQRDDFLGVTGDLASPAAAKAAVEAAVRRFGGLDILILNAGIFPGGRKIAELPDEEWRKVMAINLDSNLALMREAQPFLRLAPRHGRLAIIGSKNVPAPGPGAAAYSASKAALTQLARIAALEWGGDGIRVNLLHPDAVFDTGIWTEAVLAQRAAHYGLTVDQYKRKNVLRTEVTSRDVAELAAEMCGPLFAKTTGAQVPIDGGNDRVI